MTEVILDSTSLQQIVSRLGPPSTRVSPLGPGSALFSRPFGGSGAPVDLPAAQRLLEVAHRAATLVQIDLAIGGQTYAHLVCFAPESGQTVAISPTPHGVILRQPPPREALIQGISSQFGSSRLRAVSFSIDLDPRTVLVLCAALDVQRRRTLADLASGLDSGPVPFDARILQDAIRRTPPGGQALVSVVRRVAGELATDPATIDWALNLLVQVGHVGGGARGLVLVGEALALARRFLVVGGLLRVRVAHETRTREMHTASLCFVQAGVHDCVMLEAGAGSMTFITLSAAAAVDVVTRLLDDPTAVLPGGSPRPARGQRGTEVIAAVPDS
jgi:hypothetical protein